MNQGLRFVLAAVAGLLIGALLRPDAPTPPDTAPPDDWPAWQTPADPGIGQLASAYRRDPFWRTGPRPPTEEELAAEEAARLAAEVPAGTLLDWRFLGTARSPDEDTAWLLLEKPEGEQIVAVRPGDRLDDDSVITAVDSARVLYRPAPADAAGPPRTRHLYEDRP